MKILVVDDEPAVRSYTGATLTRASFDIELAADGHEALRLYSERGPFDLVLTDLEHPGPNGLELRDAILALNQKQRIGFVSGFPLLEKPFRAKQLLDFVDSFKADATQS